MKPIKFEHQTQILAEDQPEYENLPIHLLPEDENGAATSCWKLTWKERLQVLFTGKIWHTQLTFRRGFMPVRMATKLEWEKLDEHR